jgi:ABC-type molybdate transport system substrate-binding protein
MRKLILILVLSGVVATLLGVGASSYAACPGTHSPPSANPYVFTVGALTVWVQGTTTNAEGAKVSAAGHSAGMEGAGSVEGQYGFFDIWVDNTVVGASNLVPCSSL